MHYLNIWIQPAADVSRPKTRGVTRLLSPFSGKMHSEHTKRAFSAQTLVKSTAKSPRILADCYDSMTGWLRLSVVGRRLRQRHDESRAFSQFAFDRYGPTHLLYSMLNNRKAQAGAAYLT